MEEAAERSRRLPPGFNGFGRWIAMKIRTALEGAWNNVSRRLGLSLKRPGNACTDL